MKQDQKKRWYAAAAGASLLLSGCAQAAAPNMQAEPEQKQAEAQAAPDESAKEQLTVNGYSLTAQDVTETETIRVANVQGEFAFDQNVLSPEDDVANLYGTAITGLCAKPDFAFLNDELSMAGDYYINVSGSMKYSHNLSMKDLKDTKGMTRVMACTCATGPAVVSANVTGIALSDVLSLCELTEAANTLTVTGSDGYQMKMPLSYALDREAMIVYQVNGKDAAQNTQFWLPGAVARYFTRDIVSLQVTAEETVPQIKGAEDEWRAKVSIVNNSGEAELKTGKAIQFQGYADDCASAIATVEFSLDGGETWTACETPGATADKWVYWYFTYTPEQAGDYELQVRARTADGKVSPLASTLLFRVTDAGGM